MQVRTFTVGNFQTNTYLLTDEAWRASRPSSTPAEDEPGPSARRPYADPDIQMILLTHTHLDHAGALSMLQEVWDVPTYRATSRSLRRPMQGTMFGMPHLDRPCGRIVCWIDDGDTVKLGETTLRFLSTPGRTPGQGWYDDEHILVGDTLFSEHAPTSRFQPAAAGGGLRRLELPGHLKVWSGHGPVTTIGQAPDQSPGLHPARARHRGSGGHCLDLGRLRPDLSGLVVVRV